MQTKTRQTDRRLRVRRDRLRQLGRQRLGTRTDVALAIALGMDQSALCNLLSGKSQPGPRTILNLLDRFDVTFEDLFEAYDATSARETAAA